jgi:general secretion pathway protein D
LTNGLRSGGYAIQGNQLDSIVNHLDRTSQQNAVAPGVMAITGLFTDGQVQTLMRGLNQKKGVDIMSNPSTITRSGQQASISIVQEFIYPTEYEPPQIPTSVGNGTTAPVVPAMPTAFEKRDVGVALEVLPVADADKRFVDITLNPSFSNLDGFVNYGTPINSIQSGPLGESVSLELTKNAILMPVFNVQRLNTQLTVLDGSTIAIGGLMSETIQNVTDKVPVLGDLPWVGRLFSSEAKQPVATAIIFLVHIELLDPTGRPYRKR